MVRKLVMLRRERSDCRSMECNASSCALGWNSAVCSATSPVRERMRRLNGSAENIDSRQ